MCYMVCQEKHGALAAVKGAASAEAAGTAVQQPDQNGASNILNSKYGW